MRNQLNYVESEALGNYLGARDAYTREKVSFQIGFEDSVIVDRSEMTREIIPMRRASISKSTRGKTDVDTRLREEI